MIIFKPVQQSLPKRGAGHGRRDGCRRRIGALSDTPFRGLKKDWNDFCPTPGRPCQVSGKTCPFREEPHRLFRPGTFTITTQLTVLMRLRRQTQTETASPIEVESVASAFEFVYTAETSPSGTLGYIPAPTAAVTPMMSTSRTFRRQANSATPKPKNR